MPNDFVDLAIVTNASQLADRAIQYLQAQWPGWTPNEGDMEVIQIEALALLAANAANVAAYMPMAALIQFGVKMLGQAYGQGSAAYTSVTFTMIDAAGYTIPAGSEIIIDNYAFAVVADAVVAPGATQVTAQVASAQLTAAANGLVGSSVTPLSTPAAVIGMQVTGPTANGTDPQTDLDYVNQISRDRRLTTRAIVTLVDHELTALDQPGIVRAHADTIGPRQVQTTVLGVNGALVPDPVKAALLAIFNDPTLRIANVQETVVDPTVTNVAIAYQVRAEPAFDPTDLVARINSRLALELSPLGWGVPDFGDPGFGPNQTTWINDPIIRINTIIGLIASVQGVRWVGPVTLNAAANDLALPGLVALPNLSPSPIGQVI